MLRRSTSLDTSPMPMKMAIKSPKTDVAARPRSLMILMSCPAVNWPSRYDAPISRIANTTRLYGTRSRTDSRKTFTATVLMARIDASRCTVARARGEWRLRARALPHLRHPLHEKLLQRVSQRVESDQGSARGREGWQDPLRQLVGGQLERVSPRRDLCDSLNGRRHTGQ